MLVEFSESQLKVECKRLFVPCRNNVVPVRSFEDHFQNVEGLMTLLYLESLVGLLRCLVASC